MLDLFTTRPAGDILSRSVRITLDGIEYVLPVLRIAGNRRWKAQLDAATVGLVDSLEGSGDDVGAILALLASQTDTLLDLLISYDTTGVLPSREAIEETAYEDELLLAVRGVWRAANPLVAIGIEESPIPAPPTNGSLPPTSTSPTPTAGRRKKSKSS